MTNGKDDIKSEGLPPSRIMFLLGSPYPMQYFSTNPSLLLKGSHSGHSMAGIATESKAMMVSIKSEIILFTGF